MESWRTQKSGDERSRIARIPNDVAGIHQLQRASSLFRQPRVYRMNLLIRSEFEITETELRAMDDRDYAHRFI